MIARCLLILGFLGGLNLAHGQDSSVPPELNKTFERYARAWENSDWGRVFDITAPAVQKVMLNNFGSREAWIKHQDGNFKDKITSLQRVQTFRMLDTVYTFAIVTKGKRPGGGPFGVPGFATFEFIDGKWYLVEPVVPKSAKQAPSSLSNPPVP